MTIIIGIKCFDGIVIACDSRTTNETGHINDNAEKLHVVRFKDGNTAIVGEAGNAIMSSIAIEQMQLLAKDRNLEEYRAVAQCAEDAIAHVKQKLRTQFAGTAEELQRHFEAHAFELMISHYHKKEPYLFTVEFALGIASKKDKLYTAIGCGWQLADFIIDRIDLSAFGTGHGMWTAVYAVEEIKKCDSRCGGTTRAALITTDKGGGVSCASVMENDLPMRETISEALAFSDETKSQWSRTIEARINAIIKNRSKAKTV